MKKVFTMLALAVLLITACKKDKENLNKLSGEWIIEDVEVYMNNYLGNAEHIKYAFIGRIFNFNDCGKNTFCKGHCIIPQANRLDHIKYKVSEDESTLIIDEDGNLLSDSDQIEYKIELVNDTDLQIYFTEEIGRNYNYSGSVYIDMKKTLFKMKRR